MVIVDTSVWVDYLNDVATQQTTWLNAELERQRLGLTDWILCEVLQGMRTEKQVVYTKFCKLGVA
jgi:predicted nucleic acid-binding protein